MEHWDVVVVGAGPAGAAAALAARRAAPAARVLLLDRADFPRDKACGDGIAPEALDVLAELGVARPISPTATPPSRGCGSSPGGAAVGGRCTARRTWCPGRCSTPGSVDAAARRGRGAAPAPGADG